MGVKVKIQMNPTQSILLKRGLNKNGKAQRFFTHEMRRIMDSRVPFLNGPLKNTAIENENSVDYIQPYAEKQYYENKGNGQRGPMWDKRAWAEEGDSVVESVADFVGGKPG